MNSFLKLPVDVVLFVCFLLIDVVVNPQTRSSSVPELTGEHALSWQELSVNSDEIEDRDAEFSVAVLYTFLFSVAPFPDRKIAVGILHFHFHRMTEVLTVNSAFHAVVVIPVGDEFVFPVVVRKNA